MNLDIVLLREKLNEEDDQKVGDLLKYIKCFAPKMDEVRTREAYQVFGSKQRFDYHIKNRNITPVKGENGAKSRMTWSRHDIYNLKRSENAVVKFL